MKPIRSFSKSNGNVVDANDIILPRRFQIFKINEKYFDGNPECCRLWSMFTLYSYHIAENTIIRL